MNAAQNIRPSTMSVMLYGAKPALREFYRSLDPCNCFNPGIGATPTEARWRMPSETTCGT